MKRIRGGSGLGDALYVRPIAEHFIRQGEQVTVCSNYKDVFRGSGAVVEPFSRERIDVLAHYVNGKQNLATTQWQDVCRSAGVTAPLEFRWKVRNPALIDDLHGKAAGRPIILVHGGRAPMARTDGFGKELLPDRAAFEHAISGLGDCFLVMVGKGEKIYPLPVDLDLNGSTTVSDVLDVGSVCKGMLAQCSFVVPMAECFSKPLLVIWSMSGLTSRTPYVKSITPTKILSKATSHFVMDDLPAQHIRDRARGFHFI